MNLIRSFAHAKNQPKKCHFHECGALDADHKMQTKKKKTWKKIKRHRNIHTLDCLHTCQMHSVSQID